MVHLSIEACLDIQSLPAKEHVNQYSLKFRLSTILAKCKKDTTLFPVRMNFKGWVVIVIASYCFYPAIWSFKGFFNF